MIPTLLTNCKDGDCDDGKWLFIVVKIVIKRYFESIMLQFGRFFEIQCLDKKKNVQCCNGRKWT